MTRYRPVAETADTVTLRRADYEAMVDALEEAADLATVREVAARVAAGEDEYVPTAVIERLAAGQHPVRVWREHRGLTGRALAQAAQIPASYLCEIEAGRKPGLLPGHGSDRCIAADRHGGPQALAAGVVRLTRRLRPLIPLGARRCWRKSWPGRFGVLGDLIGATVFLRSDDARYVTG